MKGIIYRATSPSGKKYYGQTKKTLDERKMDHYKKSLRKTTRFYTAIKKYGIENFLWEVVEVFEEENEIELRKKLDIREKYWIKRDLSNINEYGYNMTDGGGGGDTLINHPDREKIIRRRAERNIGKKRTPEMKKIISEIQKEICKKRTLEEIKDISEKREISRKIRIQRDGLTKKEIESRKKNAIFLSKQNKTEEQRKIVSEKLKGKPKPPFSAIHRENIGKSSRGRDIPGKKILINSEEYKSLHEASRILNIPIMTIRNRLISKNFPNYKYLDN